MGAATQVLSLSLLGRRHVGPTCNRVCKDSKVQVSRAAASRQPYKAATMLRCHTDASVWLG